jgi:hypothetical protein
MNLKKFLPLIPVILLAAGCSTAKFTRLSPIQQPRNPDNLYAVEVAFTSKQQSLRLDSIQPHVLVNGQTFPLRPVPVVKNRWEGLIPVPPTKNSTTFRFKFDYLYNAFGSEPQRDSAWSPTYTLKIVGQ